MIAPLYTAEILRLAASLPAPVELDRVDGKAEERSPTCGSRVRLMVQLDEEGRIAALTQEVEACAFGQASATILAMHAVGRDRADINRAIADLSSWLPMKSAQPGDWPGLDALGPARARTGRHGAILLPFRALSAAMKSGGS